jgi:hypothetical protein
MRAWVRGAIRQAHRQPLQAAAGGLVLVAAVLSSGSAVAAWQAKHDADASLRQLSEEAEMRGARLCVQAWRDAEDTRNAVERGTRGGVRVSTEGLVAVAAEDADPQTIADYRAVIGVLTEAEVAAARAEVLDPDCDLADARSRLQE